MFVSVRLLSPCLFVCLFFYLLFCLNVRLTAMFLVSAYLFVCLLACLLVCLTVCDWTCLSVSSSFWFSASMPGCLFFCQLFRLSLCMIFCLSFRLSGFMFVFLNAFLSVCLFVHTSVRLSFHFSDCVSICLHDSLFVCSSVLFNMFSFLPPVCVASTVFDHSMITATDSWDHRVSTSRMEKGGRVTILLSNWTYSNWPLPYSTVPVPLFRDARPAGWLICFIICSSTMPRSQNRAAKGSTLKEDEILFQSGYIIYLCMRMRDDNKISTKMYLFSNHHVSHFCFLDLLRWFWDAYILNPSTYFWAANYHVRISNKHGLLAFRIRSFRHDNFGSEIYASKPFYF